MSVLVKSRKGGANYIYSVLMGYDHPPQDFKLDEGVYYTNTWMVTKLRWQNLLWKG